ncbi:MAG: SDR family NAD(P)-dependent oxidoreductase [Deltaproteobacteria bacterium]|nr:MAG: SDR family NAD(P)-dependent oxidoreductase [Deltaproteobacteria bacterium]
MKSFENKVALITGASSGIGEALAQEFVKEGAQVVLLARRLDRLGELAQKLNASGDKALALECDVTRDGDLEKAAAQAVKKFGKIDVVVANAGFGVSGNLVDLNLEDYRRQFETNVFGLLRTIYATKEELKKSKGSLALVSSVSGYVSVPGISPYSMSKYAVRALAEALVTELHPLGVSTTLISPGFINTEIRKVDNKGQYHEGSKDMIPDWLCMPAQKAARIMVKAIARRKIEVIVTGHGKFIVGLSHRMPKMLIRLMRRFKVSGRPQPRGRSMGSDSAAGNVKGNSI